MNAPAADLTDIAPHGYCPRPDCGRPGVEDRVWRRWYRRGYRCRRVMIVGRR